MLNSVLRLSAIALVAFGMLACSSAAASAPTPTSTPAPLAWTTYTHHQTKPECDDWPNFSVNIPSDWNVEHRNCQGLRFEPPFSTRDLYALLEINIRTVADHRARDHATVLRITQRQLEDLRIVDGSGGEKAGVDFGEFEGVQVGKDTALAFRGTSYSVGGVGCPAVDNGLAVPERDWPDRNGRMILVLASHCQHSPRYSDPLDYALSSFRLVEPFRR